MVKEYEKDIQSAIIQYLRLKRYVVFKHHSTGFTADKNGGVRTFRYGDKGISDIIGCSPGGRFIAIEVKRKGGRPTDDQIAFLESVRKCGGIGFVAASLDAVISALDNPDKVPVFQMGSDKSKKVALSS